MDYKYCVNCGEKLQINVKFCPNCGVKQSELANNISESEETKSGREYTDREMRMQSSSTEIPSYERSMSNDSRTRADEFTNTQREEYRQTGSRANYSYSGQTMANTQEPYNESGKPGLLNSFNIWLRNWNKPNVCMGRADYWWGYLAMSIIDILLCFILILAIAIDVDILFPITWFTTMLVSVPLSVLGIIATIERLHDTGKSGWYFLIGCLPFIGEIIIIVLCCQPTDWNQHIWPRPHS